MATGWSYTPYLGDFASDAFAILQSASYAAIPRVDLPGTLGPRPGTLKHSFSMSSADTTVTDDNYIGILVQSPFSSNIDAFKNNAFYNQQALRPLVTLTPTSGQFYTQKPDIAPAGTGTASIAELIAGAAGLAPALQAFNTNYLVSVVTVHIGAVGAAAITFDVLIDFSHTLVN